MTKNEQTARNSVLAVATEKKLMWKLMGGFPPFCVNEREGGKVEILLLEDFYFAADKFEFVKLDRIELVDHLCERLEKVFHKVETREEGDGFHLFCTPVPVQ